MAWVVGVGVLIGLLAIARYSSSARAAGPDAKTSRVPRS